MDLYLASRYSRHPEMQEVAKLLQEDGHVIKSRWIWGNHEAGENIQGRELLTNRFAHEDLEDVISSDIIVIFAEEPRTMTRGGKHFEFGVAYALGLDVYVVGGDPEVRENIFYWLNDVKYVKDIEELRETIGWRKRSTSTLVKLG